MCCNNEKGIAKLGNKFVTLERGQMIYGRRAAAKYLSTKPDGKDVDRMLGRLSNVYKKVTMQRSRNYTIITVLDYDNLVSMTQQTTKKRPSNDPVHDHSPDQKSVKSVYISEGFLKKTKTEESQEDLLREEGRQRDTGDGFSQFKNILAERKK